MIIGNNFQRLNSPCTHTISQLIVIVNGHLVIIDKLNKAYTHQKIKFTHTQHDEKVVPAQGEVVVTILLLELSIKE